MKRSLTKFEVKFSFVAIGIVGALVAASALSAAQPQSGAETPAAEMKPVPALTPYVDAHTHFSSKDPQGSVGAAVAALSRQNAAKIILLSGPADAEAVLPFAKKYPGKLIVLGGASLSDMIIQSATDGDAGPAVQKKFKERAEELLREGIAGFGEMTAEHFGGGLPYQYAPADHPLFLLLADIAAQHDVPIDLHMETVPEDMPLPADLKSPPNPPHLHANVVAFERLLTHNPRAKIIWAHAGTDNTGFRTPDLCRRLLLAHSNLYMEIKADPSVRGKNYPLDSNGEIKPEWLKLYKDFPDQFIIGSDQTYPEPKGPDQRWQEVVLLFNQLPGSLREKIGTQNISHIYDKVFTLSQSGTQ